MNVHDSEKVIGTLVHEGYRQVQTVKRRAGAIQHLLHTGQGGAESFQTGSAITRSIRKQGKKFGVLGCVAQQEGERFSSARLMCRWCADRRHTRTPQMLIQIEAGNQRVTGLDDRKTEDCFETEFTARTNPHRGLHHHHRRLRQVLLLLRGAVHTRKERSRTAESVLAEARQMAISATPKFNYWART